MPKVVKWSVNFNDIQLSSRLGCLIGRWFGIIDWGDWGCVVRLWVGCLCCIWLNRFLYKAGKLFELQIATACLINRFQSMCLSRFSKLLILPIRTWWTMPAIWLSRFNVCSGLITGSRLTHVRMPTAERIRSDSILSAGSAAPGSHLRESAGLSKVRVAPTEIRGVSVLINHYLRIF